MLRFAVAVALMAVAGPAHAGPFSGVWRIDEVTTVRQREPFQRLLANGHYRCLDCLPVIDGPADGRFHPTKGRHADEARVTVVDARTVETEFRKGGKRVYFNRLVVAPDGKTLSALRVQYFSDPPVEFLLNYVRVTPAPAGAHLISGGWEITSSRTSERGLTTTINDANGAFSVSGKFGLHNAVRPNERFSAPFDGSRALVDGHPDRPEMSVARAGERSVVLTEWLDGKRFGEQRLDVAADGRTMTSRYHRFSDGFVMTRTLRKQSE